MRLLLMADGAVGSAIAQFLMERYPQDLALLVTTSDNDLHALARQQGIATEVFQSEAQLIQQAGGGFDLGLLAWWPKIVRAPLLHLASRGFVNTHPSLLPYNRGKHYNFWAIVEQAPFGVTLHQVDEGIDSGPILAQQAINYDWTDTGASLYTKAQAAMVQLFCASYPALRENKLPARAQATDVGSFHHSSELDPASQIKLDSSYRAADLLNLLRARTFAGHPGCWFEDKGVRFQVTVKIERLDQ